MRVNICSFCCGEEENDQRTFKKKKKRVCVKHKTAVFTPVATCPDKNKDMLLLILYQLMVCPQTLEKQAWVCLFIHPRKKHCPWEHLLRIRNKTLTLSCMNYHLKKKKSNAFILLLRTFLKSIFFVQIHIFLSKLLVCPPQWTSHVSSINEWWQAQTVFFFPPKVFLFFSWRSCKV